MLLKDILLILFLFNVFKPTEDKIMEFNEINMNVSLADWGKFDGRGKFDQNVFLCRVSVFFIKY